MKRWERVRDAVYTVAWLGYAWYHVHNGQALCATGCAFMACIGVMKVLGKL